MARDRSLELQLLKNSWDIPVQVLKSSLFTAGKSKRGRSLDDAKVIEQKTFHAFLEFQRATLRQAAIRNAHCACFQVSLLGMIDETNHKILLFFLIGVTVASPQGKVCSFADWGAHCEGAVALEARTSHAAGTICSSKPRAQR